MAQQGSTRLRRARRLVRALGLSGTAVAALVLVAALAGVGLWGQASRAGFSIARADDAPQEQATDADEDDGAAGETPQPEPSRVVVHVDGAVRAPGVYELSGIDARVNDAVACAGGLAEDADTAATNLAAPVHDGDKVHIPRAGEEVVAQPTAADATAPEATDVAASASAASGLVNLNTATAAELATLPGVGEVTAAAIVDDRAANGPFSSPEDVMRVSGIGEKRFAKLRDQVCV